jgi:hypothetical protein
MHSITLVASKVPFIKGTQKTKETINLDDLVALLAAPSDKTNIEIRNKIFSFFYMIKQSRFLS